MYRFCLVSVVAVYLYSFNYQAVDEDEFGGAWEITKEGFVTSFAGFLVSISVTQTQIVYWYLHFLGFINV